MSISYSDITFLRKFALNSEDRSFSRDHGEMISKKQTGEMFADATKLQRRGGKFWTAL